MKKSLLNETLRLARAKLHLHPQKGYFLHYSFVIQDNAIVDWATNHAAAPKIHFGYSARLKDAAYPAKTHSELAAYRKARGLLRSDRPWAMVNVRLSRTGEAKLSKPCVCCQSILPCLGCRKVYFSSEAGFLTLA